MLAPPLELFIRLFVCLEVSQSPNFKPIWLLYTNVSVRACVRVFVRVYSGYASLCLCFDVVLAVNFIAKYYQHTRNDLRFGDCLHVYEWEICFNTFHCHCAELCVLCCCCCCSLTHKHTLNSLLLYRSDICIMCDFWFLLGSFGGLRVSMCVGWVCAYVYACNRKHLNIQPKSVVLIAKFFRR